MTPKSVRITGWGMYAPERRLTNAELERVVDTSDEWIVSAHRHPRATHRRARTRRPPRLRRSPASAPSPSPGCSRTTST